MTDEKKTKIKQSAVKVLSIGRTSTSWGGIVMIFIKLYFNSDLSQIKSEIRLTNQNVSTNRTLIDGIDKRVDRVDGTDVRQDNTIASYQDWNTTEHRALWSSLGRINKSN